MIDVREVRLETRPSRHERFFEPVIPLPVGTRMPTKQASEMIVWLLRNPGMWLRWSNGSQFPVSARPLNNENFDKWRGGANSEAERGLWVRCNRTGI